MFSLLALLGACLAAPPDRVEFVSETGNFKLTHAKEWRPFKTKSDSCELALTRGQNYLNVSAVEVNTTREDVAAEAEAQYRAQGDAVKVVRRQEIEVAGEKALVVEMEVKAGGTSLVQFATFTHQGMAYRVLAGRTLGNIKEFKEEFYTILDSFEFRKDRKEWLAQYEGRPATTALLGGLAQFSLNRPRWTDVSLDSAYDHQSLDHVAYELLARGAVLNIYCKQTHRGARAKLDELARTAARRMDKPQTTERVAAGNAGPVHTHEVAGQHRGVPYLVRDAVLVEEGIAVEIIMECVQSQQETTQRDWEQLLRSFELQKKSHPGRPLAFPIEANEEQTAADPGLAALLKNAEHRRPATTDGFVLALSADGSRVLVWGPQGTFLENLDTREREPLPVEHGYFHATAWSRDGRRIARASATEIVVTGLDGKNRRQFPGGALQLVFGPGPEEMLLCTHDNLAGRYPARFSTSRLEKLDLKTGRRQVLLDSPLGRVTFPALSPDGRRLALVSNRDCPRTALVGGHLYVGAADGTGLRQVTQEPEEITGVTWSSDGKWLYAIRRLAALDRGQPGPGGSPDLYRVSPETGQAVNLTRSGGIHRIWNCGPHLILDINAVNVPESQRGLFRIDAEALARSSASRPIPPVIDAKALGVTLATHVRAALGGAMPGEVVVSEQVLEKAAKAFAEAAGPASGYVFDFTGPSLDRLLALAALLRSSEVRDSAVTLGLGAYYGETARRAAGAEWKLQHVRLNANSAERADSGNALVQVVLPFQVMEAARPTEYSAVAMPSEYYAVATGTQPLNTPQVAPTVPLWSQLWEARKQGQRLILVHPPAHADEAVRQCTPANFQKALARLDAGDAEATMVLLGEEMRRQPRNAALAREVIAVCEALRRPELAGKLASEAVEAGNEVPEMLWRHGDRLAATQPQRALEFYRKAVRADWYPAEALLKLGRHYAALGQKPLSELCYRRAYWFVDEAKKQEIRKLLGLKPLQPTTVSPQGSN